LPQGLKILWDFMGYFPEFYGISSDSPRHYSSLLISLILRPGNSMGLYGIFPGVLWEKPCIVMAITEEFMGIL
jgi:hypothetical protein